MASKKGIGSYPAEDPGSSPSGGNNEDVNLDEKIGSKKREEDAAASDPERIQRDLDRYRDEMAEDAPASGSPEDQI
jgi:hypothetical protein